MRTWFDRVRGALLGTSSPVIIVAGDEWGVSRLLATLRDADQPLVFVDLRDVDCEDSIAVGNAISEGVRRGLGASLFGLGLDAAYALAAVESFVPALEPITVAVSGIERRPDLIPELIRVLGPPNRLVLHAAQPAPEMNEVPAASFIAQDELAVTVDEAIDLFGGERDNQEIVRAVEEARGAVVSVEERLMLRRVSVGGGTSVGRRIGSALQQGASGVIDALVARRRWIEAFEFAVDQAPTRISEVLDEAGNAYFELGQFDRFWRFLSNAPRWALRDEQSMYWLFNAAIAVNQWRSILPQVDRYLLTHDAPDLRARRATVDINEESAAEAIRAHEAKRTPETARALAFIMESRGELDAAAELYREAIELSEIVGRPRHIVGASAGMAQLHLFSGRYDRAQHWGAWAVQQYSAHELREELLRVFTISVCAYARILVGAVHLARQVLEGVRVHPAMVGIPTMEGVISTLGDLALAEGRLEAAVSYYKLNLEGASRRMYCILANDLVVAYLLSDQVERAVGIASEAKDLADVSSGYQQTVANLSLGCALARVDATEGERLLREALTAMRLEPMGPHRAQGALHLGQVLLRQGRYDEARHLLDEHAQFITELGDSGWLLLGGNGPEVAQLKRMFRSGEPEVHLRLLGKRTLRNRDQEEVLSLRFAELLTVLAATPNGIRGEQLALALYGDRASTSTMKATISRTRKLVPIDSKPYRIGEAHQADFMRVFELLRAGRVQAALELYRGPLLPQSEAPGVVDLREQLEESLRQAVLASGDPDAMIDLANQQGDDLELWEETRRHLPPNDPRRPLANARIRRIRKRWGS